MFFQEKETFKKEIKTYENEKNHVYCMKINMPDIQGIETL
jgi:hypothetical protein